MYVHFPSELLIAVLQTHSSFMESSGVLLIVCYLVSWEKKCVVWKTLLLMLANRPVHTILCMYHVTCRLS